MNFRGSTRHRGGAAIDITPLVDVVFILLIFLLISTTFRTREHAFTIRLPKANAQKAVVTVKRPTVYISSNGDYYLYLPNGSAADGAAEDSIDGLKVRSLDELELRLQKLKERQPSVGISVKADSSTEFQKIMDVVDQCYKSGIERVFFPFRSAPK